MKKHIKYVPITTFAAAIALGGSLSAAENTSTTTGTTDQQSQVNIYGIDKSTGASTSYRSESSPITASDVLGMNIDTTAGEKIGEIDEIFVNSETGEVLAIVVSTGGFLNMGDHQTLISPKDLSFKNGRTSLEADFSKEQIRTAPRYKKGDSTGIDQVRPLTRTGQQWDAQNKHTTQGNKSQSIRQGIALSDLNDMDVKNSQGEDVGEVEEVYLDLDNQKVLGLVVATGGVLGIGERQTLFGLSEFSFKGVDEAIVVNYNNDEINGFQEFKSNDPAAFSELQKRTNRLTVNKNRFMTADNARNDTQSNADRENYGLSSNDARTNAERESAAKRGPLAQNDHAEKRNNTDDASEVTVFNQGNSYEEIAMTASIRKAISQDESLSIRANNVSIITTDEKVVLRGSVDTASEKASVEKIAHNKAGLQNVTSELTVRNRRGQVGL